MTLEFGWRRFNFFDKAVVLDKENPTEKFLGLKDVDVDCWCSAGGSVFLGETKGGVFRLTNQLGEYYWKAYQTSLASLHSAGKYLFSIGEDDDTVNSILKIWDPETIEKNAPLLKKTVRMSSINSVCSFPACSVAVHSSLTAIAVGYADGSVMFFQGDVIHDKSLTSRWIKVRDTSVVEGAVTGLAIAFVPGGKTVLFVITLKHVFSYVIENRNVTSKNKHEANGATTDCWTFEESTGQLIVASREMVYFYDADQSVDVDGGVGRCLQLGRGHDKLQLVAFGQYLSLLTKQHALIQKEAEFMTMMTVYDVKGQYIGFSCSLPNLCRLFVVGNSMLILSKDGTLSELTEKNLNTKLDILFKKNLFDVAVGIAKNSKDGTDHLKSIHAKYGDYLYQKGDYENAINQYKETIGMLEPSYVIKKYLDGSKLPQLCVYLECLHDAGKDNPHHTNILLNAYARQAVKEKESKKKLMQFVNKLIDGPRKSRVKDVLKVLLEWNYLLEASLLATKFEMHDEALSAIIDHMQNYSMGVKYISRRPVQYVIEHLQKFGRILLEKAREETLSLLLDFVTRSNEENIPYTKLFDIFIGDNEAAEAFIEFAIEKAHGPSRENLTEVVLEIRIRAYVSKKLTDEEVRDTIISLITPNNEAQALHLAQVFDCSPVIEYVLLKSKKWKELMQYYQKKCDLQSIIKLCNQCPDNQKQGMWLDFLSYIAKHSTIEQEDIIINILQEIEDCQAVHPLVVLEILSKSENLTISTVKDYVIHWLKRQEEKIEADKKQIRENEKQMLDLDEQIESLKFKPQVLQVSKCSACDTALQVPNIHFLCKHAFHVHCFESYSDGGDSCPACTNQTRVEEPETINDRSAYPKFQKELENSNNSMELIAKYLENGLFNERKHTKKSDIRRAAAAAVGGATYRSSSTTPFDDDESVTMSRTMSTVSSVPQHLQQRRQTKQHAVDDDSSNPFLQSSSDSKKSSYDESKNPFGKPPKSTNPFGDD